ncbi:MAG: hypothetical protein ACRDPG_09900 [Nocardioidaceae bacterium]
MAFTAHLKQTREDLEKSLVDPTPLYAVVGAGDLAAERLRALVGELNARAAKLDAVALREQARAKLSGRLEDVQADVQSAPEQVRDLPLKAQVLVGEAFANAVSTYGVLAGRGKTLVTRVRDQQASQDLEKQLAATVSRIKAATTTARRSADTTAGSVKQSATSTATTASASAAKTRKATKAAATSTKKSAGAAKKATARGAKKVGD